MVDAGRCSMHSVGTHCLVDIPYTPQLSREAWQGLVREGGTGHKPLSRAGTLLVPTLARRVPASGPLCLLLCPLPGTIFPVLSPNVTFWEKPTRPVSSAWLTQRLSVMGIRLFIALHQSVGPAKSGIVRPFPLSLKSNTEPGTRYVLKINRAAK